MNKLSKIGIPLLVAASLLVFGTGIVMAQGNNTSALANPSAAYDRDGKTCPQWCQNDCYDECPYAGNCNGDCRNYGTDYKGSNLCFGETGCQQAGNYGSCGGGNLCNVNGQCQDNRGYNDNNALLPFRGCH